MGVELHYQPLMLCFMFGMSSSFGKPVGIAVISTAFWSSTTRSYTIPSNSTRMIADGLLDSFTKQARIMEQTKMRTDRQTTVRFETPYNIPNGIFEEMTKYYKKTTQKIKEETTTTNAAKERTTTGKTASNGTDVIEVFQTTPRTVSVVPPIKSEMATSEPTKDTITTDGDDLKTTTDTSTEGLRTSIHIPTEGPEMTTTDVAKQPVTTVDDGIKFGGGEIVTEYVKTTVKIQPPFQIPNGEIEEMTTKEIKKETTTSDATKDRTTTGNDDYDQTNDPGVIQGLQTASRTASVIPTFEVEMTTSDPAKNTITTTDVAEHYVTTSGYVITSTGVEMMTEDMDFDKVTTNVGADGSKTTMVSTMTNTNRESIATEVMESTTDPVVSFPSDHFVTEDSRRRTELIKKTSTPDFNIPTGDDLKKLITKPDDLVSTTTTAYSVSSNETFGYQSMKNLLDNAFNGYDKRIRPRVNQSRFVFIQSTFVPMKIIDFDTQKNNFSILGYFKLQWRDDFLTWTPEDYGNTLKVRIPSKDIWLPRLSIKKSQNREAAVGSINTDIVVLTSKGYIQWWPEATYSVVCAINIKFYPLDEQTCTITYYVADEDNSTVKLVLFEDIITSELSENAQWDIINITSEITIDKASYMANFHFTIKRRAGFAMFTLLFPAFLMSGLCCSAFLVPVESGEKGSIAINVFLACLIYVTIVTDNVPKNSSELSYFVLYVIHLFGLSVLLTFYAIVQSYLYQYSTHGGGGIARLAMATAKLCQPKVRQLIDIGAFIVSVLVVMGFMSALLILLK